MRKLYIDFTKPKNKKLPIFSWAIRAFQNTPYSHVRLRWTSTTGIELIYEASGSSVKVIGENAQSQYPVEILKSYEIDITNEEYRHLIKLFRYASVDYGFKQVIGIVLAKWLNLKKNPFSKGQVCSELIGLALMEVKKWTLPINLDLAGPKEIDDLLESMLKFGNTDIRKVIDNIEHKVT